MKNFDDKIKESRDYIKTKPEKDSSYIYQKALNSEPEKKPSFYFRYSKAIRFAALILIVCSVFTAGFFVSKAINDSKIVYNSPDVYKYSDTNKVKVNYENNEILTKPSTFSNFESKEDIINYLSDNKNNNSSNSYYSTSSSIGQDEGVKDGSSSIEESSSSYKTNTQEENVDEADIVKVCGNHIFFLPNVSSGEDKKLIVFTEENGKLNTSFIINYSENEEILKEFDEYNLVGVTTTIPQDLFVTDKYVVVRISKYSYKTLKSKNSTKYPDYNRYDYANSCLFHILDINTLNLVTTIETAGSNVSTRLIGNELYVINNYIDYLNNDNLNFYYPYFYIDLVGYEPLAKNIYYNNDNANNLSYVSVYKITLDDEINISDLHIITPIVNKIYSSENNIYLIRNYCYEDIYEEEYRISYYTSNVTVVNIENGLSLSGSFVVKGNIDDKYWIDEKDDYIRVVSTGTETKRYYLEQRYVYQRESKVFNQLSIFKKTEDGFILSGLITEGLGKPGESVKSARFNDDVVTIVTYKNTDPLYYIDISDPENPIITSSLEITGYGVYQHPYKDKYIISFGYEDNNYYKITLFDVSDKENIKQVGNSLLLENRKYKNNNVQYYSYYASIYFLNDPKALFVNEDKGLFGFKLNGSEYTNSEYNYIGKYYILTINEESDNPIILTQIADYKYNKTNYNSDKLYYLYKTEYQRMVFIGNNYYLLSENNVICYKLKNNELVKVETIEIKIN